MLHLDTKRKIYFLSKLKKDIVSQMIKLNKYSSEQIEYRITSYNIKITIYHCDIVVRDTASEILQYVFFNYKRGIK